MATLPTVNAHFDGTVIVPDEPLELAPGEKLRVTIERAPAETEQPRLRAGSAKGMIEHNFTPFASMTATLMNGDEWDEGAALHVDSLDRIPEDFVRQPGSGSGEIEMAVDFNDTPEDFKEYL